MIFGKSMFIQFEGCGQIFNIFPQPQGERGMSESHGSKGGREYEEGEHRIAATFASALAPAGPHSLIPRLRDAVVLISRASPGRVSYNWKMCLSQKKSSVYGPLPPDLQPADEIPLRRFSSTRLSLGACPPKRASLNPSFKLWWEPPWRSIL